MILLALIIFSTLILVYWYSNYKSNRKWAKNLPGYNQWFWESPAFFGIFANKRERVFFLCELAKKYPKVYYFNYGLVQSLFFNDPELVRNVLTSDKCLKKPKMYRFLGFGNGLVTAPVKVWKIHRKLLNPALSIPVLHTFIPIFDRCSRIFADLLESHLDGEEFDLRPYSTNCTFDTICETSFGIKVEAQRKKISFQTLLERAQEISAYRASKIFYHVNFIYWFTSYYKEEKIIQQKLTDFINKLINQRRQILKNDSENNNTKLEDFDQRKPRIFIDYLLAYPDIFNDEAIKDHVFTMIVGGNRTTGLTLAYAVLFMAIHLEVQDRVYKEICEIFPEENTEITYEKLLQMQYVDMVLKETLRLAPTLPLIGRTPSENINLNGLHIPKGTLLTMSAYTLHYREEDWGSDCHEFNPDRFQPERDAVRHNFAYLPFSAGTRSCIGRIYGKISLKIMLIHLLRRYKFSTSLKMADIEYELDVHLHIKNGCMVSIDNRN